MKKILLILFVGGIMAGTLSFFMKEMGIPYAKDAQQILVWALMTYFLLSLKKQSQST
jgi:hypothetical protein